MISKDPHFWMLTGKVYIGFTKHFWRHPTPLNPTVSSGAIGELQVAMRNAKAVQIG